VKVREVDQIPSGLDLSRRMIFGPVFCRGTMSPAIQP